MKKSPEPKSILALQNSLLSDIRDRKTKLAGKILPGGKLTAKKAIRVYQQGYAVRLTDAIATNYEAMWYTLGDKKFFKLCDDYRAAHPSTTYNLNIYGDKLPSFVATKFPKLPYLQHLARFEWLLFEVFNSAENASAFDLSKVNAEKDVFVFQPSARLFSSPFRVYELWRNRRRLAKGYSPKNFISDEFVLLYKYQHRHYFAALTQNQFAIMHSLLKGKTITQAIMAAGKKGAISEKEVSELFALIASPGVVKSLRQYHCQRRGSTQHSCSRCLRT